MNGPTRSGPFVCLRTAERPYTWGDPGTNGASPSGKAADFGSAILGSNPSAPAIAFKRRELRGLVVVSASAGVSPCEIPLSLSITQRPSGLAGTSPYWVAATSTTSRGGAVKVVTRRQGVPWIPRAHC
jgi:hypothetical protein